MISLWQDHPPGQLNARVQKCNILVPAIIKSMTTTAQTAHPISQFLGRMPRVPKVLETVDFQKVKLGENVSTRGGAKFFPLTHEDGSPILLDYGYQSVSTPFRPRAFGEETKVNFLLSISTELHAYVEQLTEQVRSLCKTANVLGNMSEDSIHKKFVSPFRSDDSHSPLLRTKIETAEVAQVKVWSTEGLRVPFETAIEQLQGGSFKARIKLRGLWMQSDKSHGISLAVDDIMLQPCEEAEDECPFPINKKARTD